MSQQKKIIKTSILDDHPMITDGITHLLKDNSVFVLSSIAHSWEEMISNLESPSADILVLDLNIRGTNISQKIPDLKNRFPAIKILIFSSYNTPSIVKKAFAQDIDGYLLKDTTQAELLEALSTISQGKIYVGKRVAIANIKKHKIKASEVKDEFEKKTGLTKRELEVLQLICQGMESKEIASKLFISQHTVQSHRKNIMRKLDVHSAAEIVKFALKNGLI